MTSSKISRRGLPMHSPSALTEHVPLNLARLFLLDLVSLSLSLRPSGIHSDAPSLLQKSTEAKWGVEWNLLLSGCSTHLSRKMRPLSAAVSNFPMGLPLSLFLSQSHSHPSMQQIFADQWASSHLPISHLPIPGPLLFRGEERRAGKMPRF